MICDRVCNRNVEQLKYCGKKIRLTNEIKTKNEGNQTIQTHWGFHQVVILDLYILM